MDRAIIGDRLRANGIPFSAELPERLETYFRLLMEWNEKMDLVAAAEEDELLDRHLTDSLTVLKTGLLEGRFLTTPAALFNIRIALAEATASAVQFELQASGGKAYLCAHGSAFARRWRESAFVPIVTPSLVQLRAELLRQAKVSA